MDRRRNVPDNSKSVHVVVRDKWHELHMRQDKDRDTYCYDKRDLTGTRNLYGILAGSLEAPQTLVVDKSSALQSRLHDICYSAHMG